MAPAPFLPTAGDPAIPWKSWLPMFRNFMTAVGGDDFTPTRQRAMLLTRA